MFKGTILALLSLTMAFSTYAAPIAIPFTGLDVLIERNPGFLPTIVTRSNLAKGQGHKRSNLAKGQGHKRSNLAKGQGHKRSDLAKGQGHKRSNLAKGQGH